MSKIVLASASPRRKELMKFITEDFEIIPSDEEEIIPDNISAVSVSEYLAKIKARNVSKACPGKIVIGADTTVILDEKVLGKPKDESDAFNMLKSLSGKTHFVTTGVCICGEKEISFTEMSRVTFRKLFDSEIFEYINTKEPMDKAGAYAIQGKGKAFVENIEGDYDNIVGLPVKRLKEALLEFGSDLNDI